MQIERRQLIAGSLAAGLAFAAPLRGRAAGQAATKPKPGTSIQRLAWAGIRFEHDGVAMIIDGTAPDPEHGYPGPPLTSGSKRTFALVTHSHTDHCDPKALKDVLGDRGYLVADEESARLIDNRIVRIQPVQHHEPVYLSRGGGEFVAFAVPASDGLGSPQVSWVIDDGTRRFIHCGDTEWHGGFWDIARAYGPFDMAFLPINGFRQAQGRFVGRREPMSLTPEQAVEAGQILGARELVPIHFGSTDDPTYVEELHLMDRFLSAAREAKAKVRIMMPGAIFSL